MARKARTAKAIREGMFRVGGAEEASVVGIAVRQVWRAWADAEEGCLSGTAEEGRGRGLGGWILCCRSRPRGKSHLLSEMMCGCRVGRVMFWR